MGLDIASVEALEENLSRPAAYAEDALAKVQGDVMVLGAGGKMGPTLTRMIKRAVNDDRRVIAVSRFSNASLPDQLRSQGIDVLAGDLLDQRFVDRLPECPNIFYLAGMKFGATGNQPLTWAMNTHLPSVVCRRFPQSRIVALSTGNVYGLTSANGAGSGEDDNLNPVGEYANSCLGRERMFEYFSSIHRTPVILIRLNYANELRYGVLVDLAQRVLAEEPIDVTMGYVNVIWQGDANAMIVGALAHTESPPSALNIAGCGHIRVRDLCEEMAERAGLNIRFTGEEAPDALLSDATKATQWFGKPAVPAEEMITAVIQWLQAGGETLGKPTKFENRRGNF